MCVYSFYHTHTRVIIWQWHAVCGCKFFPIILRCHFIAQHQRIHMHLMQLFSVNLFDWYKCCCAKIKEKKIRAQIFSKLHSLTIKSDHTKCINQNGYGKINWFSDKVKPGIRRDIISNMFRIWVAVKISIIQCSNTLSLSNHFKFWTLNLKGNIAVNIPMKVNKSQLHYVRVN